MNKSLLAVMYKMIYCICIICIGFTMVQNRVCAEEVVSESPLLRVALTGKYPPFSYYDNKGELTGFDVDVSKEVATRLGRKLEIIATEWDGKIFKAFFRKYHY